MITATSQKSLSVRPRPLRYVALIGVGLFLPVKIHLERGNLDPASQQTMLLVGIVIGIAIVLATASHWFRSRLDISLEGVRHVSWRTHFVAVDRLQKIKVGAKSGTLLLSFYSQGTKSPLFSISSFSYGSGSITRIVEHIQAQIPHVKVDGYESGQDLGKREVDAAEQTNKQTRMVQGTFALLFGGYLLYMAMSPGSLVSPIFWPIIALLFGIGVWKIRKALNP